MFPAAIPDEGDSADAGAETNSLVRCSVWHLGGRSMRGRKPVNGADDELSLW